MDQKPVHIAGKPLLFNGAADEHLSLTEVNKDSCHLLKEKLENGLTLLWFTESGNKLVIDGVPHNFEKNQIVCLTEFHRLEIEKVTSLKQVKFNKPFYCILDHDTQIGCRGILFFGASDLPVFHIPDDELDKFETLWKMFTLEFESKDNLQIEMLQMMLKRLLIFCARLYKEQNIHGTDDKGTVELIREFNFLVETHFRTIHGVAEYAELLHKSPKTLANYFSKHYSKSPIQIIRDRIMIEARRLLLYSDKPIKELAYELGFDSIQTFSRSFKKKQGISPSEFRG